MFLESTKPVRQYSITSHW